MLYLGVGKIATVIGRYFAMDRDKRWDRIEKAYNAMVLAQGRQVKSATEAMGIAYTQGETDEFIMPTVILDEFRQTIAKIQDGDVVLFFNFRADRAREITQALTQDKFEGFVRQKFPKLAAFVCMAEYDKNFALPVAFPPEHIAKTLGEIISQQGLKQLRIAETEKYAHVTFFFNGGEEATFPGEERILVPSAREVATYDLKPEMSAPQITEKVLTCIAKNQFEVIILNFANSDMVGHTGKLVAAIKAVEVIDEQLGKISQALLDQGGTLLLTADHGNVEKMADAQGNYHTAHTTELVPFLLVGKNTKDLKLRELGTLADIAPTILQLLKIEQPPEMTGKTMIVTS